MVTEIALRLAARPDFSCRFLGYELVSHHKTAFAQLGAEQILKLGEGLDSWNAVDCFGLYLSGPAWRDGQISGRLIRAWGRSKDRWWRRAALVSTIALSRRGEPADVRRTVEMSTLLVADRDDMVVKALSWALRELAKKYPEDAKKFLEQHRDRVAARVRREVENKIATGLKNPRVFSGTNRIPRSYRTR
jgi:3-methyladenine DNA glycosylase AlkD